MSLTDWMWATTQPVLTNAFLPAGIPTCGSTVEYIRYSALCLNAFLYDLIFPISTVGWVAHTALIVITEEHLLQVYLLLTMFAYGIWTSIGDAVSGSAI